MPKQVPPVPAGALRRRCDPAIFEFETTADVSDGASLVGQERATDAIRFGVDVRGPGFHLFVVGPPGLGKRTHVHALLAETARSRPTPPDWVYVHGFEDPRRPQAIALPPGRGAALVRDAATLVGELRSAIPAAFDTDEYRNRRRVIEREVESRSETALAGLQEKAQARGLALLRTPMGFALAPVRDGEVLPPDQFHALPEDERKRIQGEIGALEAELQETLRQLPRWHKEARERLESLDREVTSFAIDHLLDDLRRRWDDVEGVRGWIDAMRDDLVAHAHELVSPKDGNEAHVLRRLTGDDDPWSARYRVNLLVDRRGLDGAPVVEAPHPVLENLLGRIGHRQQLGALTTDFTLVEAGALHRANGGFLVLDARRLLGQPAAWEGLKRALRAREIRIESLAQALGWMSTVSLEPMPIPLEVKVVLVGDRRLHRLLSLLDPELGQLFKVQADFEHDHPRSDVTSRTLAHLVAGIGRRDGLLPLHRDAVATVVEEASRRAGDAHKLSTAVEPLADLLREADWIARRREAARVDAIDVDAALAARIRRVDQMRDRDHALVAEGTVHVATRGEAVGAVNALSVVSTGDFAFGRPTRITARTRLGKGEVIDIEREVELGGPLHTKGVLILAGYLGATYAADRPLSLRASLVFEQSYGPVDGDSASMAELCALLSSLSNAPIGQRFAITGSVDQMGRAQPIGGVDEKVEGFFDVCRRTGDGLDGRQGVLVPEGNLRHLMLRRDVVEACAEGRFSVWAYRDVDQAIAILTGLPAGVRGPDGAFPEGSVHRRVEERLEDLARTARRLAREAGGAPAVEGPDGGGR